MADLILAVAATWLAWTWGLGRGIRLEHRRYTRALARFLGVGKP